MRTTVLKYYLWLRLSLVAIAPALAAPPEKLSWDRLRDVTFKKRWYPEENMILLAPKFGPTVKALDGKAVSITGYMIPIDLESGLYALSRYPMSGCFFCGGAGPESVMTLKFTGPPRQFKTDDRRSFSGTLRLNADNPYEMNYILEKPILQPTTRQ